MNVDDAYVLYDRGDDRCSAVYGNGDFCQRGIFIVVTSKCEPCADRSWPMCCQHGVQVHSASAMGIWPIYCGSGVPHLITEFERLPVADLIELPGPRPRPSEPGAMYIRSGPPSTG